VKNKLLSKFTKIEQVIIVIILVYSTGVWWHPQVVSSLLIGEEITEQFSGIKSIINIAIYIITLLLISRNWKKFFYVITRDKFLLTLVGLAVFSFFWSNNPAATTQYLKGVIRVTLLGAYLATRYSLKEQIRLFAWTFGIAAILSLLLCIFVPSQGIQISDFAESTSSWRGFYYHKNHLGRLMIFGSGTFLLLALTLKKKLLWALFSICLSLSILSRSANAQISFVMIIAILILWKIVKFSFKLRMFLIHILLLLIGLSIVTFNSYAEPLVNLMGKDLTLTGRLPLWTALLEKFSKKPWFGYGYHGFWDSDNGTDIRRIFGWAGDAHNGFLEIALTLGIVGLLILLISLLRTYLRASIWARLVQTPEGLWPLQVLVVTVFGDLSTSPTLLEPAAYWMLYVSIALSLALEFSKLDRSFNNVLEKPKEPIFSSRYE
jgi:exopolysaccharide production protein ExoQ